MDKECRIQAHQGPPERDMWPGPEPSRELLRLELGNRNFICLYIFGCSMYEIIVADEHEVKLE